MWELLLELFSWIFTRGKKSSSSRKVESKIPSTSEKGHNEKTSLKALQYYNSAEENRKAEQVEEAEKNYWESIRRWNKYEGKPAPAPFRKLAKLYYHTGFDEKALEVLDLYMKNTSYKRENFKDLRERLANGDFRRLKNKYDEEPTGNYP